MRSHVYLLVASILFLTVSCKDLPVFKSKSLTTETKEPSNGSGIFNLTSFVKLYTYENKKYYINFDLKVSFLDAFQLCKDIGMQLVSIETKEENSRLYKYLRDLDKGTSFWASGTKFLDGDHWIWMSPLKVIRFTNWQKGDPNNLPSEHCIELIYRKNVDLVWNNLNCNNALNFICEKVYKKINAEENDNDGTISNYSDSIFQDVYVSPNIPLFHFEGKSYFVGRHHSATYFEAFQLCKMINMHLVKVESEAETKALHKYIRDTGAGPKFWSSGTRIMDGKTWIWMVNGQFIEYTNWAPSEPNMSTEFCIMLQDEKDGGLFWHDHSCTERLSYICEKPRLSYNTHSDVTIAQ